MHGYRFYVIGIQIVYAILRKSVHDVQRGCRSGDGTDTSDTGHASRSGRTAGRCHCQSRDLALKYIVDTGDRHCLEFLSAYHSYGTCHVLFRNGAVPGKDDTFKLIHRIIHSDDDMLPCPDFHCRGFIADHRCGESVCLFGHGDCKPAVKISDDSCGSIITRHDGRTYYRFAIVVYDRSGNIHVLGMKGSRSEGQADA